MAVRIRLRRTGAKKQTSFRVVVADKRSPRDGRFIDTIGFYNPRSEPETIDIDREKALEWLEKGALPSDSARSLLSKVGIWQEFKTGERPEPKPTPAEPAERKAPEPEVEEELEEAPPEIEREEGIEGEEMEEEGAEPEEEEAEPEEEEAEPEEEEAEPEEEEAEPEEKETEGEEEK